MKVKALKNFKCNGVKKVSGSYLSKEELDHIGEDHFGILKSNDFVMVESGEMEKPAAPVVNAPVKPQEKELDLDKLGKEDLMKLAYEKKLDVDGRMGEAKLRDKIKEMLAGE